MFWIIGGGDVVHSILNILFHPLPRSIARHFKHAEWIGFTGWDLIMPLFLFISGTAIPFALSKRISENSDKISIYRNIIKRALILFILGMIIQGNLLTFNISKLHLFCNALQAIACGYAVASCAFLTLNVVWQAVLCAILLIGYWVVMKTIPIPGQVPGLIDPNLNVALYIDQIVLGRFRADNTYTWVLSSMTFSSTVILGMLSGRILKSEVSSTAKILSLTAAGFFCLAAGIIIGIWFPVIKHIWSSSFVLVAAGFSFLLLALFYGIIDVFNVKKWSFFFSVIGSNALFIYCLSALTNDGVNYIIEKFNHNTRSLAPLLLYSSLFALHWCVLYMMFKRKIFIKI